jgi:putative transposase
MKEENILCKRKRKFIKTTDSGHKRKIYPNLVPTVDVNSINKLWVSDITFIALRNGFAYLATITDVFSRKCIGWDVDVRIDALLCVNALKKALLNRKGQDLTGLIHHSDRGSQYASEEYVQLLISNNISISMSRKGNPYDNPYAERFFNTFKHETLYFNECETFNDVFTLVKAFIADYNEERLHSAIGYRPPDEFERLTQLIPGG